MISTEFVAVCDDFPDFLRFAEKKGGDRMRRCRFACVGALLLALLLTGCGKAGTAPEDGGADFFGDGTGGDTGGRRRPDGEGDRPGERGLRAF